MSDLNLASAWEVVADVHGDQQAVGHGSVSRTWVEFEARSARLAAMLEGAGIGAGDNVALALYNGNEYLEAQFAVCKTRAAPCNVNYRYMGPELAYLVDNSDAKAVFFDEALTERFDSVRDRLPNVRIWIHIGDGQTPDWAVDYEEILSATEPAPRINRQGSDLWILYTGGTTGNPKGVMWPHHNLITLVGRTLGPLGISAPTTLDEIEPMLRAVDREGHRRRMLAASPLMHGTAGIGALYTLLTGGTVLSLTERHFNPLELWAAVERESVTSVSIVGDAFCRPMVDALDQAVADGRPFDLRSVDSVTSSGVMWSQSVKDRLLAHARSGGSHLHCHDGLGASEGVGFGLRLSYGDDDTETASFRLGPNAAVFTEDGRRVEPGSEEPGLLAVSGAIPLGYYGDPVKTAATFREIEGRRWSIPGDWVTLAADGTLTLLGRGSVMINTGGEKVYPEEVEEALKNHPAVVDINVVGVPDERWGSAVTAVVQLIDGASVSDRELVDSLRDNLAGYKLPKHVVRVVRLRRGPNGKSDYAWATETAAAAVAAGAVQPTGH